MKLIGRELLALNLMFFEDERMFLESCFTKCDENCINVCRDMPGAYAGLIAHERRLAGSHALNARASKYTDEHVHINFDEILI